MSRSRLRGLILPGLLVLCALAVLVSLGNWQVRRLAWKEDLIARTSERPRSEPLDLREEGLGAIGDAPAFLAANEYRPVLLRGEYRPASEVRVFTSLAEPRSGPFGGPGFWIVTPFAAEPDGSRIYVNRGFVPQDRGTSYEQSPAGIVEIKGLVRAPEQGNWFTPNPDTEKRIFYARDPLRIAAATGLRRWDDPAFDRPRCLGNAGLRSPPGWRDDDDVYQQSPSIRDHLVRLGSGFASSICDLCDRSPARERQEAGLTRPIAAS